MDFIKDLQEARLTRGKDDRKSLEYRDCLERAFLMVMMLEVMRYYRSYKASAAKYANKTVMYRDYTRFRVDSTDLYNFFYFITGDDDALNKLKDPDAAATLRKQTRVSVGKLNGYLRNIASSNNPTTSDYQALMSLEKELKITNPHYKAIRRNLADFDTATPMERQQIATRLIFAARTKLSDSDLIILFSKLVADKNLENFNATNPEPEITAKGAGDVSQLQNYKFLTNANRIPFINQFVDKASKGISIPGNIVNSYYPIIKMVHEIVLAGPAYVEQLKQVHNRAKNSRKK